MKASLRDVLSAAAQKPLPLPPDTAAFVALQVAERLAARSGSANVDSVLLTDAGEITVVSSDSSASEGDAALAVRRMLGEMLAVNPHGLPAALHAVSSGTTTHLATVRHDLERYLSPLNRSAARRVLERYVRDVLRGSDLVDPNLETENARATPSAEIESVDVVFEGPAAAKAAPGERPAAAKAAPTPRRPTPVTPPPPLPIAAGRASVFSSMPPAPRRGPNLLFATVTLLVVGLFGIVYLTQPELFGLAAEPAPEADQVAPASIAPQPVRGTLRVTSEPSGAEVLLSLGRGPVAATLPLAGEHELVAVADDGRVARALLPAAAGTAVRDLTISLPQAGADGVASQWPAPLRSDSNTLLAGPTGTVRIATSPPDARIFVVAGTTRLSLPGLPVDAPTALLLVKEGFARADLLVGPSDWQRPPSGEPVYDASVSLSAEPAPRARGRRR